MQPTPEVPPDLDRRGANRAASNWVRTALQDQSEKIDGIATEVHNIRSILDKAIPNANWDEHREDHVTHREWEIERDVQEQERKQRDAEHRKMINGLKYEFLKWAGGGLCVAIVGLLLLGAETRLRNWIGSAPTTPPSLEVKK